MNWQGSSGRRGIAHRRRGRRRAASCSGAKRSEGWGDRSGDLRSPCQGEAAGLPDRRKSACLGTRRFTNALDQAGETARGLACGLRAGDIGLAVQSLNKGVPCCLSSAIRPASAGRLDRKTVARSRAVASLSAGAQKRIRTPFGLNREKLLPRSVRRLQRGMGILSSYLPATTRKAMP